MKNKKQTKINLLKFETIFCLTYNGWGNIKHMPKAMGTKLITKTFSSVSVIGTKWNYVCVVAWIVWRNSIYSPVYNWIHRWNPFKYACFALILIVSIITKWIRLFNTNCHQSKWNDCIRAFFASNEWLFKRAHALY